MSNRTHIDNELQSIAPGLLSAPATMPYTLPQEYFFELASAILISVKNEMEPSGLLPGFSKTIPYTVPTDYFKQLPEQILARLRTDLQAYNGSDLWNTLPKAIPYTVPAGYFDNFAAQILQKVKSTAQPQEVPAGYFESLPDAILAKVKRLDADKELADIAPLLNTISRQPVQHVPNGYFESLQLAFEANTAQPAAPAPVVSLKKKSGWLKYAVAASIMFILSFGAYFLLNKSTVVPSVANQPTVNSINEQLANLDASAIEEYLKTNNAVVQTALPTGGVEELSNADLDELLQGFTDQQLKKHIEETPELPGVTSNRRHT